MEDAHIRIASWTDDRGIPIQTMAKKLIVPFALNFEAERILGSPQRPGTADNDINAQRSLGMVPGGHSVNHYLTDPDAWFLITDIADGLKHIKRLGVKKGIEGDFETGNMRYKVRERYSQGWTDPRGAYGSPGG